MRIKWVNASQPLRLSESCGENQKPQVVILVLPDCCQIPSMDKWGRWAWRWRTESEGRKGLPNRQTKHLLGALAKRRGQPMMLFLEAEALQEPSPYHGCAVQGLARSRCSEKLAWHPYYLLNLDYVPLLNDAIELVITSILTLKVPNYNGPFTCQLDAWG